MFNSTKVKPFKGRMIRLNYLAKGEPNSITGEITSTTKSLIIFNVNKNCKEIPIKYEQIESIDELQRTSKKSGATLVKRELNTRL